MPVINLKDTQSSMEDIIKKFGSELERQSDEARLIANDEGIIIYSNQNFIDISGHTNDINGLRITDLIEFENPKLITKNGEVGGKFIHSQSHFAFNLNWVISKNQKILILSAHPVLEYQIRDQISPFVELSFDAQIITNSDGIITEINQNFHTIFGTTKRSNIFDFIHQDDIQQFKEFFNVQGSAIVTRAFGDKNQTLWIIWSAQQRRSDIYLLARNITEREKHRIELEEHKSHIREAEAIANMGQWEWVIGNDEIFFSEQLYTIFGFDFEKDKPTLDSLNDMIHEDDDGRMMQVFQRAIIEQNNYDMDFRIQRHDGQTRFIKCEGRCRADHEDDVIALYGVMHDVTDAMKRERDLVKAKESVEKAYAAKTQFLANMSHELRTPLNAVIGFSEMMERQLLGPLGNEKYLDYISGIRKSGEHLLALISDILDMSKIEAGKYDLSLEDFNIAKTARLAVHMVEGRALNDNVKIIVNVESDKINVIADRRAVMQIMLNLLSNAVKFSNNGGSVTLNLTQDNDSIFLEVSDNGIGIPSHKLSTIMEPFEQVENDYSREYEGTGLGLSITKELIEIHGGTINIVSTLSVGTEVLVKLPKKTQIQT